MKSYNRDIASLIRSLFDRISETPENAHEFINQVYSNLNKYGDKFFASPKQVKWLHRLGHIIKVADEKIAPTVSEEEMTPLQRLREKKRLLIKRAHRRRKKNEASGVILAKIIETRAGIVPEMTAQVKHAKSGGYSKSRRQIAKKG